MQSNITHPQNMDSSQSDGGVRALLQAEGLLLLAICVIVYSVIGGDWLTFALIFLLPDVSMLGYGVNKRLGALVYNLGHTYLVPALLAAAGARLGHQQVMGWALIWAAHISFDRAVGYGLKYPESFQSTHLSRRNT